MKDEHLTRPWAHAINKAAWTRRHKFGVDGRLLYVICPLLIFGGFGFSFGRVAMLLSVLAAGAVWFAGKLLWAYDPWFLDRMFLELRFPRWMRAVREKGR